MPIIYLTTAFFVLTFLCFLQVSFSKKTLNLSQISFWLLIGCLHGLFFKPFLLFLGYPSKSYYDKIILYNINSDIYWKYAFINLFFYSTLFFIIIFISKKILLVGNTHKLKNYKYSVYFPTSKIYIFILLPTVALILFLYRHGLYGITGSKNVLATLELKEYSSSTSLRVIIWMFYVFSIMSLSNIACGYKKFESKIILMFSLLLWVFFCLVSDARGLLIFTMFGLYSFHIYTGRIYKISTKFIMILSACFFIFFSTANRFASQGWIAFEKLISNIMGRNLLEIGKSAHIHEATDELGYSYGSEILNTLLIYIPREIYPNKDILSNDTFFGMNVFGADVIGGGAVPPGLLGEALFSFDWSAAISLLFFIGFVLGLLQQIADKFYMNRFYVLAYFSLFLFAGLEIAGSGYTSFLRQFFIKLFIILILTSSLIKPKLLKV